MTDSKRPRASSKEFDAINEKERVFKPHVYNPPTRRATGRTFRMLLKAVLACSSALDKRTIYVIGVDGGHCHTMFNQTLSILNSVVYLGASDGEILMPNGSRIMFATKCWFDKHKHFKRIRATNVFEDHYIKECRYDSK